MTESLSPGSRQIVEKPLLDQLAGLGDQLDLVEVNGEAKARLAGTLNLSFSGVDAEDLIEALPGLALSTASACASASLQPSYVLRAIGLDDERLASSLRVSIGRFTTGDEIGSAIEQIVAAVSKLA